MAVGFGLKAIERGYRVLFTTAAAMLTTLTKALSEGRFDDKLKIYTIPRLLIIDEIGYLPIDRQAATLFFQLISRRYERGPMILTSNQSFGSWGDVFGDRVIASAIPRPDPASRHDDQHPGRLVPAEGQVEVGGRQADDRGSVSCGLPVDAAVPVDALPRDHGDLDRPQTACPQAPTGVVVVVGIHKGGGGIFDDHTWGNLNDR